MLTNNTTVQHLIDFIKQVLTEFQIQSDIVLRMYDRHQLSPQGIDNGSEYAVAEDWKQLSGLCIIVSSIENCYLLLGAIHERWRPMGNQFRDFIAMPE